MSENNNQQFKKDDGKIRLDLVPLEVLEPLAKVREFAAQKYGEDGIKNWDSIDDERYLAALLRHLVAYQKNPAARDKESGLPSIYHVLCNAAFLAIKRYREEQDLAVYAATIANTNTSSISTANCVASGTSAVGWGEYARKTFEENYRNVFNTTLSSDK